MTREHYHIAEGLRDRSRHIDLHLKGETEIIVAISMRYDDTQLEQEVDVYVPDLGTTLACEMLWNRHSKLDESTTVAGYRCKVVI